MHTVTHKLIETHTGEPVRITFTVTDQAGSPVSVEGATATWRVARRNGEEMLLEKTQGSGITLSGNTAVVEFNTEELVEEAVAQTGDFFDQLKIVKNGDGLIVAEGPLFVAPVITD